MKTDFLEDITNIQLEVRKKIEEGCLTHVCTLDMQEVIDILNHCLSMGLVCASRYKTHHYRALRLGEHRLANEFFEHAAQEQHHADMLAIKIDQLGGTPNFSPNNILEKTNLDYEKCIDVVTIVMENLVAKRIAIATYKNFIQLLSDYDPSTRRLIELILEKEEQHAEDLKVHLYKYKHKNNRLDAITCLKLTADSLGDQLSSDTDSIDSHVIEQEICNVVSLLNYLDNKNNYEYSDFMLTGT